MIAADVLPGITFFDSTMWTQIGRFECRAHAACDSTSCSTTNDARFAHSPNFATLRIDTLVTCNMSTKTSASASLCLGRFLFVSHRLSLDYTPLAADNHAIEVLKFHHLMVKSRAFSRLTWHFSRLTFAVAEHLEYRLRSFQSTCVCNERPQFLAFLCDPTSFSINEPASTVWFPPL